MSGFGTAPFGTEPFGAESVSSGPPVFFDENVASAGSFVTSVSAEQVAVLVAVMAAMDATTANETVAGVSSALLTDTPVASARLIGVVSEQLRLDSRFGIVLEAVLSDTVALADLAAGNPRVTVALIDTLLATGAFQSSIAAMAAVVDVLALRDVLRSVADADLDDAAMLASELQASVRAMEALVSAAMFSDDLVGAAMVTVVVPETFAIDDTLASGALRLAAITEAIAIGVSLVLDGVPYLGLAMNTDTRGITEYDNYQYNSLASFNGALYGAGAAGLYRLDGPDGDESVDAYLRTALLRLGGGKQARVNSAYLGYRSNGTLQLKVITTGNTGSKVAHVYQLAEQPADSSRAGRIKVGRGLKSVYWAFELANIAGADFDLDVLQVHPLILDRRLP